MGVINVEEKLSLFADCWNPRIIGEMNGQHIKAAKLKGEFIWHAHEHEDEMFFVLKGRLVIRYRDGDNVLEPGEFLIIPRGVEHLPVAEDEVHVLLIEPAGTVNTGGVVSERTVAHLEHI